MDILDYRTINLNRIVYNEPCKVKGNCLMTQTKYNYNERNIPIYIQTPRMKTINGLVMNDTRSYIELEINKNHVNFYDFINSLDEHNVNITYTNSENWFEQKLPLDVIEDFYNSPVKMTKMNTLPTIKLKVPIYKTKKNCEIFSENGQTLEGKQITKNTDVICILELSGIKYYKHRFECEWNVVQIKAFVNDDVIRECMVREDLLSDNEDESTEYSIEEKKNKNTKQIMLTEEIIPNQNLDTINVNKVDSENIENVEELENIEESENVEELANNDESENVEESENREESENVNELDELDEFEELEELEELDNLEEIELNEPKNINELMNEINELKQRALEKDEEVTNLKNKYKNLYQELNL